MNSAGPYTFPGSAAVTVLTPAHRTEAMLQGPCEILRAADAVVLHAKPQWPRRAFSGEVLVRSSNQCFNALLGEAIVAEVYLLDGFAVLEELSKPAGAVIVDLIAKELQNPKVWASSANIDD